MNYIAHIPLIGGFPLAAIKATGELPIAITSYSAFFDNDNLFLRYLKKKGLDVPYLTIEDEKPLPDLAKYVKKIDFIVGTPPCAGLSMSGNLKAGARQNSPVNDWMINSVEYVLDVLKPKVYAFENAPGLYTGVGDNVREQLINLCEKYDYSITFYKTDTLLHGIPQRRPRTYAIIAEGSNAYELNYNNSECQSTAEYLKDIPEDALMQDVYMSAEPDIKDFEIVKFLKHEYGDKWRDEFLMLKDHLTSYDFLTRTNNLDKYKDFVDADDNAHPSSIKDINHVIKKVGKGLNYRLSHRVLCVDKHHVYAVIGEMMERNIHPTEDRRMNMREYLHLMGMPHDFELYGRKEFGKLPQNTPVGTSEFIVNEVMGIINNERETVNSRVLMQNNIKQTSVVINNKNSIKLF